MIKPTKLVMLKIFTNSLNNPLEDEEGSTNKKRNYEIHICPISKH